GTDDAARDKVLKRTVSGGVTVNDTLMHVAQEHLPFGGVGKSGSGAYHGEKGFETFSHMKPVFYQSRFSGGKRLQPPFSVATMKTLNLLKKII
ncbi:MAG: aldehyde dehydrogenase family protein, partial [Amphiplicatus sp.]